MEAQAPFLYDWPASVEMHASGEFRVTPFYIEGCKSDAKLLDVAITAARRCIEAFVIGGDNCPVLSKSPLLVDPFSARLIHIRLDVMSRAKN
jgi:hypothetical protein